MKHKTIKTTGLEQKKACTYYVKGMHCASCEILIENDISKLGGIHTVKASLHKGEVTVVSVSNNDLLPEVETLNRLFGESGYKFFSEKPQERKLNANDASIIAGVVALFILTFLLFEKTGTLAKFSVNPSSPLSSYFVFGLAAGLSSCAALVGGLLLSLSKKWTESYNGNQKKSFTPFVLFNSARLLSFAVLGGVLGLIGSLFQISIVATTIITILVTLLMLLIGLQMLGVKLANKFSFKTPKLFSRYVTDENNFSGKAMPFLIGAATFLLPCGFTIIAQTNAVAAGSFARGALIMFYFALGTLPVLALISFTSVKLYSNPAFSSRFSFFAGLLITFFALYTLNSQLNVLGVPSLSDLPQMFSGGNNKKIADTSQQNTEGIQVVQMYSEGFEYFPKQISLKSGVPTRIEFDNRGAIGCANALYARGLYPKVVSLKDGLNIIEFTAPKPGVYKISCSMGMVPPVTVNVY